MNFDLRIHWEVGIMRYPPGAMLSGQTEDRLMPDMMSDRPAEAARVPDVQLWDGHRDEE